MKTIEIDDELYKYIASQTHHIGENASSILRRLLSYNTENAPPKGKKNLKETITQVDFSLIYQLIKSDTFRREKKRVSRFLAILSLLYHSDNPRFSLAAASLRGSKRRYLATCENALVERGKNTKPKAIHDTPYWVITNNNTNRKCYIIESIMNNMGFSQPIIGEVVKEFVTNNEV